VPGRGPPGAGGGAVEIIDEDGGFADAEGDEPGINRWGGGAVAGADVLEAVGAGAAFTGSMRAEPAATGACATGRDAGAGRSSAVPVRGALVGAAGNDDGVAAGLGGGAAVADPLPATG
jgi:hypothetical protein